jgi:hypothetical protein
VTSRGVVCRAILGRGFDLEVRLQATAVAGILARCLSPWLT